MDSYRHSSTQPFTKLLVNSPKDFYERNVTHSYSANEFLQFIYYSMKQYFLEQNLLRSSIICWPSPSLFGSYRI